MVPRERFSLTSASLESLFDTQAGCTFNLIYIDGNSPKNIKKYLENKSKEKGFELIRTNRYLTPNEARNIAINHAKTKYIVFVDNDLLFTTNWLKNLVDCAEATNAWLVGPLYLIGDPKDEIIHMGGGKTSIEHVNSQYKLIDVHRYAGKSISEVKHLLKREKTENIEFHCLLARIEIFEKIGMLDDKLMSVFERIDISLLVQRAGGDIYMEPSAVISYEAFSPFKWFDSKFFNLRWSDEWTNISIERMKEKWQLNHDDPAIKKIRIFCIHHRRLLIKTMLPKSLLGTIKIIMSFLKKLKIVK